MWDKIARLKFDFHFCNSFNYCLILNLIHGITEILM